jgi:outer membrane protein assembly factor BamB
MRSTAALLALAAVFPLACSGGDPPPRVVPSIGRERPVPAPPAAIAAGAVSPLPVAEGEDVLALVRAHNTAPHAPPPRQFRSGHVTPRQLDPSAIRRTEGGFRAQLPSRAPIVTPTVHAGLVITSGGFHSRELYAFEAKTGRIAWAISLDDDGPSAAACESEVCVFNTESCTLFAVHVQTGRMLWSLWLGDPLTSAPAIAAGIVYTSYPAAGGPAGNTHALAAFDLRTGAVQWAKWIDADVMSAPVIASGRLYAASFAGTLYELAPRNGEILAARRVRATSAPIVAGGEVSYSLRTDGAGSGHAREGIASRSGGRTRVRGDRAAGWLDHRVQAGSGYAQSSAGLDSANGFAGGAPANANPQAAMHNVGRGNVSSMQAFQGSRPLHHRGNLFNTLGDRVVSTESASGRERWNVSLAGDVARAGGALAAPPSFAGGSLFVATLAGEVLRIDPDTGAVRHRYAIGAPIRSQPAIVDGWIYVGTEDGQLVAVDTGDRSLTGWTTWGANAARTGDPQG